MWADVAISFKSFADSPKNIENRKILPQILIEIPTVASLPRNDMLFCYCSAKQQFIAQKRRTLRCAVVYFPLPSSRVRV